MKDRSLPPAYFDGVYAASADPWQFETSAYERDKYAVTLAALPEPRYERAFEVGCSIGVLTAQLAPRCGALLAVDVNDIALQRARQRCASAEQVQFARMQLPDELPEGDFDLILMSEVGYYWSRDDLARAGRWMLQALRPAGSLMLVHWTPEVPDYPLTGDAVHEHFVALAAGGHLRHLSGQRYAQFRLDLFSAPG
jgi:SAM-dependent methyltransferase